MTGKQRTDWIQTFVANAVPEEPRPHHHCARCGERLVTELPIRIDTFLEVARGFIRAHRHCRPRPQVGAEVASR